MFILPIHYSPALWTIPAYVEAAKERGYEILGYDHSLQGALDFYNRCQSAGLKAMIKRPLSCLGLLSKLIYPFLVYALNCRLL